MKTYLCVVDLSAPCIKLLLGKIGSCGRVMIESYHLRCEPLTRAKLNFASFAVPFKYILKEEQVLGRYKNIYKVRD